MGYVTSQHTDLDILEPQGSSVDRAFCYESRKLQDQNLVSSHFSIFPFVKILVKLNCCNIKVSNGQKLDNYMLSSQN